jgi:molecular chaperone GrpE
MTEEQKENPQTKTVDVPVNVSEKVESDDIILEDEQLEADQGTDIQDLEPLQEALEAANVKAEEYLDGWQRSRAEFTNYKKRVERDQAQLKQTVTGSIVKRYLEIVDDLERALQNRPQEGDGVSWANGIELIYRKLLAILENEGVKPMQAEGQTFDPNLHEAITSEESDQHESGEIIEVIQQGYMIGERVLRPAMVRVAR